ncbi:hypothetical protein C4A43_03345 [Escherichia coli]|nr:hypothetical protein C4A43_03345 [Escherichia coli]
MPVKAVCQHLLSIPVFICAVCSFLFTVTLQLLHLLLIFLLQAELCLVPLTLFISHSCCGDIQVMLLTQSPFLFRQLAGKLNGFFLQVIQRRLLLQLLLFCIQQRQCLNQLILMRQHAFFICCQLFTRQVTDTLLQGQKLLMRLCHFFRGQSRGLSGGGDLPLHLRLLLTVLQQQPGGFIIAVFRCFFLNGFFVTFIFTLYRCVPDRLVGVLHGIDARNFTLMPRRFRFIHPVQRSIFSIPAFLLFLIISFSLRFCIL